MRALRINALSGLMNQLYSKEQYVKEEQRTGVQKGYLDVNSLFWSYIFSEKEVRSLIAQAKRELNCDESPKFRAVLALPDVFYKMYKKAVNQIADVDNQRILFNHLETLEIICALYSQLRSSPFTLTLSQGYMLSKCSALDMERTCLLPYCNPYLHFIENQVVPLITSYQPEVLMLAGSPTLASFAIAKLAKILFPQILIVATDFDSDYYSLCKIEHLLVKNSAFFSVYDCVILKNEEDVIERIISLQKISTSTLSNIPNIMFCLDAGQTIIKTDSLRSVVKEHALSDTIFTSKYVHNMKAFPQNKCYWDRCSFCGINNKYYKTDNCEWDIDSLIEKIELLLSRGIKKIWFLDEAIPYPVIEKFASRIIEKDLHFVWHIRTRIEPQYMNATLIDKLFQAGLRHILFGLESASKRILSLMEKTNYINDYLYIAESIVKEFTHRGIQVHFSTIIGFPSETEDERKETASFLCHLSDTYCNFTYNVNSFYLDVGSKIFRRWEEYNIVSLSFPCSPQYFLDNQLDWNGAISAELSTSLQIQKEALMERQYKWYPKGALIEPSVFFAFYEYCRLPLVVEKKTSEQQLYSLNSEIVLSSSVSSCKINQQSWMLYNLENHHYVVGGAVLSKLVSAHNKGISFATFLNQYSTAASIHARNLIEQLIPKGFFV